MTMKSIAILALTLAGLPVGVYAGMFGPENFAECTLSRMPSAANDTIALEISRQCSREFPVNAPVEKKNGFLVAFRSGSECTLKKAKDTPSALASRVIQIQCYRLYEPAVDPNDVIVLDPQPTPQGSSGAFPPRRP